MSAYNCAPYIAEAIDSIINQTFKDWELIICDDGSDDGTWDVIQRYQVKYLERIVALRNEENRKQAFSRNRCIKKARGKYIAIMDADDKCDLTRLEKQVVFLENNQDIAFVGTGMTFFDQNGTWATKLRTPFPRKEQYVPHAPFCLASCMFRKEKLEAVGGYNEKPIYQRGEDYELVVSLMEKGFRGANINDVLYFCREDNEVYNKRRINQRLKEARKIADVVRRLRLPVKYYIFVLRPLILGLLPGKIYLKIHRGALKKRIYYGK